MAGRGSRIWLGVVAALMVFGGGVVVGRAADDPATSPVGGAGIDEVTIGPLFRDPFECSQHPRGQLSQLGDALGSDCRPFGFRRDGRETFPFTYRTDGSTNEDWVGWRADVLAPFEASVESVRVNPVTNQPGTLGEPPASAITFRRDDGVRVIYAHVQDIAVEEGGRVQVGQVIAHVGNNGRAWGPHIHVGAWRDNTPLQIRFDLDLVGRQLGYGQAG